MSPQIEKLLGYPAEDWRIEGTFPNALHPEDRDSVLADHERAFATGQSRWEFEYRMIAKDGRTVWIRDEAVVVKDNQGIPLYVLGFMMDITERRLAEQALHESESELRRQKQYFEKLVRISPTAVVTMDLDERVTAWNPAAERLFGWTAAEAIGRRIQDLVLGTAEQNEEGVAISGAAFGEARAADHPSDSQGRLAGGRGAAYGAACGGRGADRFVRDLPRHRRAPAGATGSRGRHPREECVPGHHEPRDPHPDERGDRDDGAAARYRAGPAAAGLRRGDPQQRRGVAPSDRRRARLLEDRVGQAGAGAPAVRPARVHGVSARRCCGQGSGQGPGAGLPDRLGRSARTHGGRNPRAPGADQPSEQRGEVHRRGGGGGLSWLRCLRAGWSPAALSGARHRHWDP